MIGFHSLRVIAYLLIGYMTIQARESSCFLDQVLIPGEYWELVGEGYRFSEGTTVNREGKVYFNDIQASTGFHIDGNEVVQWCDDTHQALGQTFGADGKSLFTVSWGVPQVVRIDAEKNRSVLAKGNKGNDIVCHPSGNLYLTNPPGIQAEEHEVSRIWMIRPNGERVLVFEGIRFTNGIALSPDSKTLYVNDWRLFHVYRFAVHEDGSLGDPDRFIELAKPADKPSAGSDGMRVDSKGRIWVTTHLGIQVFDSTGLPLGILKGPDERQSHLVFGGTNFDTLYLTTVKAIYRRKLNVRGVNPWD